MNIKVPILFLCLLFSGVLFSQDTALFEWVELRTYPLDEEEVWTIDRLENVYVSDKGVINKYDTSGDLKFSQSIKSLGKMEDLIPINAMKLIHFSEEQQTLCYLDNTLTPYDDCIELSDQEVINAKLISSSDRQEMVWVFDDINSTLLLLSTRDNGQSQNQMVANLKGIVGIDSVSQILERSSRLYLLKEGKGVYIFDLYGSLIEYREFDGAKGVDAFFEAIIVLTDSKLFICSLTNDTNKVVPLPQDGISEFKYFNGHFFFRTLGFVHKFRLELTK